MSRTEKEQLKSILSSVTVFCLKYFFPHCLKLQTSVIIHRFTLCDLDCCKSDVAVSQRVKIADLKLTLTVIPESDS